jgi:CheY-like chemotaxis protein
MSAAVYPVLQSAVLLCIDDNEDLLECEKSFLESFGYTVLTAASGGKGLELASKYWVDVVILDYFMPEMNGQEVAIEMRRLKPQAAIIMLSGAVDVPEQALKWVDAFHSQRSFGQPVVAHDRTIVRIRIDFSAFV